MVTFSLPTLIVADQNFDYNTSEGQALLIREAMIVKSGGKSLILTDEPEKSALEKADEILQKFGSN